MRRPGAVGSPTTSTSSGAGRSWCRPCPGQATRTTGDATREGDRAGSAPASPSRKWQETSVDAVRRGPADDVELAAICGAPRGHPLRQVPPPGFDRRRPAAEPAARPACPTWPAGPWRRTTSPGSAGTWAATGTTRALPTGRSSACSATSPGTASRAAGTMGQLRNGLRAYLVEEDSPGLLLQRLARLTARLLPDVFATAVVDGARPGHRARPGGVGGPSAGLPRAAGGAARLMALEPGPPLGRATRVPAPEETTHLMVPGEQWCSTPTGWWSGARRRVRRAGPDAADGYRAAGPRRAL